MSDSFTLKEAQKYLTALTTLSATFKQKKSRYTTEVTSGPTIALDNLLKVSKDAETIKNIFETEKTKIINAHNKKEKIETDIAYFKNLVFDTNSAVGLSKIMTELAVLGARKNKLTSILHFYETGTYYEEARLTNTVETYKTTMEAQPSSNVVFRCLSDLEINDELKTVFRKIRVLEEKRDLLNSQTKITFTFSQEAKDVLGL